MKRLLIISLIPLSAFAASSNPLLTAPANNALIWKSKLKKFKRPELPNLNKFPKPFHSPNQYRYKMDDVCSKCHTYAAHVKNPKYAPFYNAHSTFMSCNTCHFRGANVSYEWAKIKDGKVKILKNGDFYGLRYIKLGNNVVLSGGDNDARIVPVVNGKPIDIPFKGNEKLMSDSKAEASMHNALSDKPLTCDDCHKPNGVIDFKKLGFSPKRVKDLENNPVVKGLKQYKVIHFPNFIYNKR